MYAASPAFVAAMRTSHRVASRVLFLRDNAILNLPGVANPIDGRVLTGSVTVSRSTQVRRTCSITITDPLNKDPSLGGLVDVTGNEMQIYRGVVFDGGAVELLPIGRFSVATATEYDTGVGIVMQVAGYDRSQRVTRSRFLDNVSLPVQSTVTAMLTIVSGGLPPVMQAMSFDATSTAQTPVLNYNPGDDRWRAASDLASGAGLEMFFDQVGGCVERPYPDPSLTPVAGYFVEGVNCTVTELDVINSNEAVPNIFIRDGSGSNVQPPIRSQYPHGYDVNPMSPTYVGATVGASPYGAVVDYASDSTITNQAQANLAADVGLFRVKGKLQSISLTCIPDPRYDVGDVIRVTRGRLLVDNLYVIDGMTIPLDASSTMTITARQVG